MAIQFKCPECQASLKFANHALAGKKIKCPKCAAAIKIPGSTAPPEDNAEAFEDEAPRRNAREPVAGEKDEAFYRKKKGRPQPVEEEGDEEDRPRKKKTRSAAPSFLSRFGLYLGLGGVALMVAAVLLITLFWPFGNAGSPAPIAQPPMDKIAPPSQPPMKAIVPPPTVTQAKPARDVIQVHPPLKRDKVEVAPKELHRLAWVSALSFSRDGRKLATIQSIGDGAAILVLQVWNFETGKELFKLYQENTDIRLPVFSPDGKRCACLYFYQTKVKVWDLDSGKELATFQAPKDVQFTERLLQFSPDGESLLSVSKHRIYRMNLVDRSVRLLDESAMEGHFHLAASPIAPDLLLAAIDLHRIDSNNGRILSNKKVSRIEAMAFSGDGKTLALAYFDSPVELLDAVTWESRGLLQRDMTNRFVCYTSVQLSNNGNFMAAVPYFDTKDNDAFRIVDYWDVAAKKWHSIEVGGFYHVALSPDGRTLVFAPPRSYLVFVDPATKQKKAWFPEKP
jgi:predicted Zn finger-like uncharacterized protein